MFTQKWLFSADKFTGKHKLFFDETFWFVNVEPCTSKQKLSFLEKWRFLLILEGQEKLS